MIASPPLLFENPRLRPAGGVMSDRREFLKFLAASPLWLAYPTLPRR